ncbi:MAG: arginase family protein [Thermodesulfobacteriota bacterium]|nr:arginase family protein [Thermodesulfobacteriota bacterium]
MYKASKQAIAAGCFPLFIGGDHSISIGTIGRFTHSSPSGLIWIDAHRDFNTSETTQTGSVHGMSLAVLNGYGDIELVNTGRPGFKLRPEYTVMIRVHHLDEKERTQLKKKRNQDLYHARYR